MEDYLKEFGISSQDLGIERFIRSKSTAEKNRETRPAVKTGRNTGVGKDRFSDVKLDNLPLTMAYVPFQQIEGTYNRDEALKSGTLFPNLDKPFLGRRQ